MGKRYSEEIDNLYFEPLLMMRTPMLPCLDWRKGLKEMLGNKTFLAAIKNASPDLYNKIVESGLHFENLAPKVRTSLEKYYNRICHRSTPFGLFAGFTLVGWSEISPCLADTAKYIVHSQTDFFKDMFHKTLFEDDTFFVNPTLYRIEDRIRYFVIEIPNGTKESMKYSVNEVESADWLDELLYFCQHKTPYNELRSFLLKKNLADENNINDTIRELLDEGLLLSSSFPSITGTSFNEEHNLVSLDNVTKTCSLDESYLNLEKPLVKGGVPPSCQEDIKDALLVGSFLKEPNTSQDLIGFKDAYKQKFGDRCIPLLRALDPEYGVGYGNLFQNEKESLLTKGLAFPQPTGIEEYPSVILDTFKRMILDKWLHSKTQNHIELGEGDLEAMKEKHTHSIPTGLSVMFRVANDGQLFLQNAGGVNPLSLLGRFTPFNDQVAAFAHDMAKKEALSNQEVIFADTIHFSGLHTANIETRRSCRDYELQIICGSSKDEEHRIPMSDLWVAVRSGQVLLWSEHHRKKVIPRLDSAYNHTISDLPLFRFLCDIQYQDMVSDFSCSLSHLFPCLSHYPRLTYRNVLLSLEEWAIDRQQWKDKIENNAVENLSRWLSEKGLPRYFAVIQGDKQIVLDQQSERDICLLQVLFKSKIPETVRLREFPFMGKNGNHMVHDIHGNAYLSEFVAFITNQKTVYRGCPFPLQEESSFCKRLNGTGDGWLYYKIFIPEASANNILKCIIMPLVRRLEVENKIEKWFFVRYKETRKFHIRLRINTNKDNTSFVIQMAEEAFREIDKISTLSDLSLHLYERELERYGDDMKTVEAFFCAGSNLVGSFLEKVETDIASPYYYTLAFHSADWITSHLGWSLERKSSFHHAAYEEFLLEMDLPHGYYKEMQAKYRQFSQLRDMFGTNPLLIGLQESTSRFKQDLSKLHFLQKNDDDFIGSLIHMHLNRFFVSDPRRQEMVFHYILWKHYESALARNMSKDLNRIVIDKRRLL